MRTFDFSPLWRSTIGFDHLADLLDSNLQQSADDNYPPYNVERCGEDAYRISLAVAGFGVDDITVTAERDTLVIEGKKPDAEQREYLYHGIAARPFRRVFNLADYVTVTGAKLENGVLSVELVRELSEEMKPRRIAIATGHEPLAIEQKQAA